MVGLRLSWETLACSAGRRTSATTQPTPRSSSGAVFHLAKLPLRRGSCSLRVGEVADGQDGARAPAQDLFGYATQQQPGQPLAPMRAQDDEVGVELVCY